MRKWVSDKNGYIMICFGLLKGNLIAGEIKKGFLIYEKNS